MERDDADLISHPVMISTNATTTRPSGGVGRCPADLGMFSAPVRP